MHTLSRFIFRRRIFSFADETGTVLHLLNVCGNALQSEPRDCESARNSRAETRTFGRPRQNRTEELRHLAAFSDQGKRNDRRRGSVRHGTGPPCLDRKRTCGASCAACFSQFLARRNFETTRRPRAGVVLWHVARARAPYSRALLSNYQVSCNVVA